MNFSRWRGLGPDVLELDRHLLLDGPLCLGEQALEPEGLALRGREGEALVEERVLEQGVAPQRAP